MPPNEMRPQAGGLKAQMTTGQEVRTTLQPGTPSTVDLAYPIVALIAELRPDIPVSVIASLVVEALDLSACMHLDGQWAEARQTAWPEAIKLAHSGHTRRYRTSVPRSLEDIGADYMGRRERGEVA
jgi:hypothetical protein